MAVTKTHQSNVINQTSPASVSSALEWSSALSKDSTLLYERIATLLARFDGVDPEEIYSVPSRSGVLGQLNDTGDMISRCSDLVGVLEHHLLGKEVL